MANEMQPDRREHETVGHRFRGGGAIYLCTRYVRAQGFWMRIVDGADDFGRTVGHETCVSERAIGRTFHRQWDLRPVEHEKPCECYVCEPR